MSERRTRRLYRLADAALGPLAGWSDGLGIDAHYDLILQSAGDRKIQVIKKIRTVTTMGMKEAKDLVDNAPGLVLHRVTSERAERARNLLEGVGATVTVSGDPAIENAMITKDLYGYRRIILRQEEILRDHEAGSGTWSDWADS
jgi:hypothetical protein